MDFTGRLWKSSLQGWKRKVECCVAWDWMGLQSLFLGTDQQHYTQETGRPSKGDQGFRLEANIAGGGGKIDLERWWDEGGNLFSWEVWVVSGLFGVTDMPPQFYQFRREFCPRKRPSAGSLKPLLLLISGMGEIYIRHLSTVRHFERIAIIQYLTVNSSAI